MTTHLLEQVRIYAYEDAEKLRPQLQHGNFTHFFMRLGGIFYDVFTGKADFPRAVGDVTKAINLDKLRGVIDFGDKDFSDDEFARKFASNAGGEQRE